MGMTKDVFDEYGNYKYPDYSNSQYTHDVSTTGGAMMGMTIDEAKWKPFDSTIPLEDGDYLVTYEDPQTHKLEVLIARYHMAAHEEDECRFYDDTGIEITLAVKAWQPLPEPYMEDD